MKTSITFVNHASVVIRHGDTAILSDPWYDGDAFHQGWNLIVETPARDVADLLQGISHIWLSHEHPDHFVPRFFAAHAQVLRDRAIPVLFQKTADGRVRRFLESQGLEVVELPFDTPVSIAPQVAVTCLKDGFYDSGLLIEAGDDRILNLNDCEVTTPARAAEVHAVTGDVDVLLTQFSYAAWKGGRENTRWRTEAAAEKLRTMALQIETFKPRAVIPFASFVYFSHRRNSYLNDAVNTPAAVRARFADGPAQLVVMQPGDTFDGVFSAVRADAAVAFWTERYAALPDAPLNRYDPVPFDTLAADFKTWAARIRAANNMALMRLVRRFSPIRALGPVAVRLDDIDRTVAVDIFADSLRDTTDPAHLTMASASLGFIFRNSFGFDTLTVNGCFEEAQPGGFVHATKTLAIENLNTMGITFSFGLLMNWPLIRLFLGRLFRVRRKLTQQ